MTFRKWSVRGLVVLLLGIAAAGLQAAPGDRLGGLGGFGLGGDTAGFGGGGFDESRVALTAAV